MVAGRKNYLSMEAKHPVRTTEKTLRLVEELMEQGQCRVTELADELDMGKSTVHNHLTTLREHGYVEQVGEEYRLGLKFLEVGGNTRKSMEIYQVAEPADQPTCRSQAVPHWHREHHREYRSNPSLFISLRELSLGR